MREDCIPRLTNVAAQSKSITDPWCHYKTLEEAKEAGEYAWVSLRDRVDVTWKELPKDTAIDPGALLASLERGFVALATLTVWSELTASQIYKA